MMRIQMSRQSLWIIFLTVFIVAFAWILRQPDYRQASEMHRKMLAMSTAAFQEAIIFTHMKYHARTPGRGVALDVVTVDHQGVDFNAHGFPVGTSHTLDSVKLPISVTNCRELWQTLLQAMRPLIEPESGARIRVSVISGECIYTSTKFIEQSIVYNPTSGQVRLKVKTELNRAP